MLPLDWKYLLDNFKSMTVFAASESFIYLHTWQIRTLSGLQLHSIYLRNVPILCQIQLRWSVIEVQMKYVLTQRKHRKQLLLLTINKVGSSS